MPVKNDDEMVMLIHNLEDKYAFYDEDGNLNYSTLNIPDDDKDLMKIRKYIKPKLGDSYKRRKRRKHYVAYDYDGNLLAKDTNKNRLIKKLKSIKSLKKMIINNYQINIALKHNRGMMYWGYVAIEDEDEY